MDEVLLWTAASFLVVGVPPLMLAWRRGPKPRRGVTRREGELLGNTGKKRRAGRAPSR